MHKQMQTKTEAMTHIENQPYNTTQFRNAHMAPHTYCIPLCQTVFVHDFVLICFGLSQALV